MISITVESRGVTRLSQKYKFARLRILSLYKIRQTRQNFKVYIKRIGEITYFLK
jgi:hypothetical protein